MTPWTNTSKHSNISLSLPHLKAMSADSVMPTDELQPPNPRLRNQEDGTVRISVGEFVGTVSSHHLVDVKINQLNDYWRKMHAPRNQAG